MARGSAFFDEDGDAGYRGELRYYLAHGLMLALCGFCLLLMPVVRGEVIGFVASWLLFIAMLLAVIRPIAYPKGLPDAVLGLIGAAFCGLTGYAAGGAALADIESYQLILCIILLFAGLARLLCFARMSTVIVLPMQLVCFVADSIAAVLILLGYPYGGAAGIYWYAGMLMLVDCAELAAEALTLHRRVNRGSFGG